MTEAAATPSVDQVAVASCVRCTMPLAPEWHTGWDKRGPICAECWNVEAAEMDRIEQAQWWREVEEMRTRECWD